MRWSLIRLSSVGLLCLLSMPGARAEEALACARPEVLGFAREALRAQDAHLELVAGAVRETSTPAPDVVSCAVTVRIVTYRATDPANYPTVRLEPRYFLVRRLGGGFEIDFGR